MILNLASQVWSQVNRAARIAYKKGWISSTRLPCRVISVGNVQAGGAGKTPLVMKIAQEAVTRGLRVCILSRGYRSHVEKVGGLIFPGEETLDPKKFGDEVALIHSRVPQVWIGVGADRAGQFQKLILELKKRKEKPIDLVILDDGYQHFKLTRDLDIVAITDASSDEIVYRESLHSIPNDVLLVLTKGVGFPPSLQDYPYLVQVQYGFEKPLATRRYYFVTGIADPVRAQDSLKSAGYSIEGHVFLPDHHPYQLSECRSWLNKATELGLKVLVTGKDAVKWQALGFDSSEYETAEPTLKVVSGDDVWNRMIWDDSLPQT